MRLIDLGKRMGLGINVLAFSDDVTLFAENKEDFQKLSKVLIHRNRTWCLTIYDDRQNICTLQDKIV